MTRWRPLGVVAVVLVAGACGTDDDVTSAAPPARPYDSLYMGLCVARARASQPAAARTAFFDRAPHQPIHELAAVVARDDRAAAARLLEAKQVVERDLAGDASGLAGDLDRLLDATGRAIVATGRPPPRPCQETP